MNNTLKIQLHQEAKKMAGTGRGKLFESALERINELERQQSEVAARAVDEYMDGFYEFCARKGMGLKSLQIIRHRRDEYTNQLRVQGDE